MGGRLIQSRTAPIGNEWQVGGGVNPCWETGIVLVGCGSEGDHRALDTARQVGNVPERL